MNFLSDNEKRIMSSLLDDTFNTFKRDIVVWKDPTKSYTVSQATASAGFGFGDSQIPDEFTYTPSSGVFQAVIRYVNPNRAGKGVVFQDTNFILPIDQVRLKVDHACKEFIENGKTEKISFDERDFFIVSVPQENNFWDTEYYIYLLKPKV